MFIWWYYDSIDEVEYHCYCHDRTKAWHEKCIYVQPAGSTYFMLLNKKKITEANIEI